MGTQLKQRYEKDNTAWVSGSNPSAVQEQKETVIRFSTLNKCALRGVTIFFFILQQDALVLLGKHEFLCPCLGVFKKRGWGCHLFFFSVGLSHGWYQHSSRNQLCQLSLLSARKQQSMIHKPRGQWLGSGVCCSPHAMTLWKMDNWESRVYPQPGQDNVLG